MRPVESAVGAVGAVGVVDDMRAVKTRVGNDNGIERRRGQRTTMTESLRVQKIHVGRGICACMTGLQLDF
jgi:hypothetical protein